eukprot:TRINITY_DN14627_c0_g1_i1.p1 TRINITY_DN14627_c0_g1~~TRINITY_DN14627_c0_g1_i1.p1  ORF type:complete len:294 (-),score=68.29 TRINITY_DN14627_c0_g1_i1:6-887(-)
MTGVLCKASSAASNEFNILDNFEGNETRAIIFKCDKNNRTVEVEEKYSNITPEDLQYEIEGNRFLAYRCGGFVPQDPNRRVMPATLWIWFNEMNSPIDLIRSYQMTDKALKQQWVIKNAFTIKNIEDFDEAWLKQKNFTSGLVKGQLGGNIDSGEFVNSPEQGQGADAGGSWGSQTTESGTFVNAPESSSADTGGSWGSQKVDAGSFENSPEQSSADTRAASFGEDKKSTYTNPKRPMRPMTLAPDQSTGGNVSSYDNLDGGDDEELPFGTKFHPQTGEEIPKFDAETGRQNW